MPAIETVSPFLRKAAARTSTEAQLRELAAAKVATEKVYLAALDAPKAGLTDDQLVDRELALVAARKAFMAADRALHEAV